MKEMPSPLRKLRRVHRRKETKDRGPPPLNLDELVSAAQVLEEMRKCYDSLLAAAAATTNSVCEFAEAMGDTGTFLLQNTALNYDADESGRVLMMLGKAQYELQKCADIYRTDIIKTITNPSESLLKELNVVEEMKDLCDQKREEYENLQAPYRRGEPFYSELLQSSFLEYQEEVALLIFRLKSLKQGQFRSLLTQASRHHVAQLNFFRRGLKHLESLEPYVKAVAEKEHIDYHFSDLGNDGDHGDYRSYQDNHSNDSELSFDYEINGRDTDPPASEDSELNFDYEINARDTDLPAQRTSTDGNIEKVKANLEAVLHVKPEIGTQSAPTFAENVLDPSMRFQEMSPSNVQKHPKPAGDKNPASLVTNASPDLGQPERKSRVAENLWQLSPLVKDFKQSSMYNGPAKMPSSNNGISAPIAHSYSGSDFKEMKRGAFSGPVPSNAGLSKSLFPASDSRASMNYHLHAMSTKSHGPGFLSSVTPKVNPRITTPPTTSPRMSDLHVVDEEPWENLYYLGEEHHIIQDDEAIASCQVFRYDVLEVATCHFSNANKLGSGGFGTVYKGTLENGKEVAVKKLRDFKKSLQELEREVSIVSELRHNNIVRFLGYCFQDEGRLLVYEYLPNNSLDKFWNKGPSLRPKLEWTTWFSIIKGVACGLQFLHNKGILHRDLKPNNVLLDDDFNPKIADFDLVRVYDKDKTHESTEKVAGTLGYMAPECTRGRKFLLSIKSDVYSYGVLVLEIITGRKIHTFEGHNSESLVEYVWQHWTAKKVRDVVDGDLDIERYEQGQQQAVRCVHIALLCVQSDRSKRPSMGEVIAMLSTDQKQMELPEPSLLGYLHSRSAAGRPPWLLPCFQC